MFMIPDGFDLVGWERTASKKPPRDTRVLTVVEGKVVIAEHNSNGDWYDESSRTFIEQPDKWAQLPKP